MDNEMFGRVAQLEQNLMAMQAELLTTRATRAAATVKPPKPPQFSGARRSELPNWLHKTELYLTALGIVDTPQAVLVGSGYLEGAALTWWRWHLKETQEGRLPNLTTWPLFKQYLEEKFKPINAERQAWDDLQRLHQGGTVLNYINQFQMLTVEIPKLSERNRLLRFLNGLKPDVRLYVEMQHPTTLNAAISAAQTADATLAMMRRNIRPESARWTPAPTSGPAPMELGAIRLTQLMDEERTLMMRQGKCFCCRQPGHMSRNCPLNSQRREATINVVANEHEKNE